MRFRICKQSRYVFIRVLTFVAVQGHWQVTERDGSNASHLPRPSSRERLPTFAVTSATASRASSHITSHTEGPAAVSFTYDPSYTADHSTTRWIIWTPSPRRR
jgi:hypothetical protein